MRTTTVNCKVDIWDTAIVARDYGDRIVLTAPYTRWADNSGTLATRKVRVTGSAVPVLRAALAGGASEITCTVAWSELAEVREIIENKYGWHAM